MKISCIQYKSDAKDKDKDRKITWSATVRNLALPEPTSDLNSPSSVTSEYLQENQIVNFPNAAEM